MNLKDDGPQALLVATVLIVVQPAVLAQTRPDAGTLQQQFERDTGERPLPRSSLPGAQPPGATRPEGSDPGQARVLVRAIRFEGNTLTSPYALEEAVRPWVGTTVRFGDLQALARVVAQTARQAGWVVHAYLPEQDVTEGIITVRVVEARFGGIRRDGPEPRRVKPERIEAILQARQRKGEPLNGDALDRGLLIADDLPGVSVNGALEAGPGEGQTTLVTRYADEPLVRGRVDLDNSSSRSVGVGRLSGFAMADSPLGLGEQVRGDLSVTEGSRYGRLAFTAPLGNDGWRGGLSISRMDYRLITPEFAPLRLRGQSSTQGLDLSYPLIRTGLANLYFSLSADLRRFRNEAQSVVQSDYESRSVSLGLSANRYDPGGTGDSSGSLTLVLGRIQQGERQNGENPAFAGSFGKLRYSATRRQTLNPKLSLVASFTGQYARRDLDTSERFYLGGPSGVRAYPLNEGAGSRGGVLNLELRWQPKPGLMTSLFYDAGHVDSPIVGRGTKLQGAGIMASYTGFRGMELRLTLAQRIGSNPNPTANGSDQDGTLKRLRWWLQASIPFDLGGTPREPKP